MGKFYRTNYNIIADKVRLIDEDGTQLGIVALNEALQKAKDLEVDLVEVAPQAKPPVCRLIDFKKFKYQQAKKEQEDKKRAKSSEIKEVRLGPFIAKNDLNVRLERTKEFLSDGNRVKITVRFSGRQMAHPEFGHALLKQVLENLKEDAKIERDVKFEGRELSVIVAKLIKKEETNAQSKN